jgi:hypothetical protein
VNQRGVELKEATVGQRGGQRRRRSVDKGAVVGAGTTRGEIEVGVSGRRRSKRGSSSVGRSPYSRTRRWPWAAEPVGGEAVVRQGSGHGPDMVGMGGVIFRTRRMTGGRQWFRIFLNYPNWLKLGN